MKLSTILRWAGPTAIAYGLFLVVSDMSGMPLPGFEHVVPTGSSAVGSGLILWALVLLLVGMMGLYVRLPKDDARAAAEREARYREWELDEEHSLDDELATLYTGEEEAPPGTTSEGPVTEHRGEQATLLSTC